MRGGLHHLKSLAMSLSFVSCYSRYAHEMAEENFKLKILPGNVASVEGTIGSQNNHNTSEANYIF